jgi:hypothetical protein
MSTPDLVINFMGICTHIWEDQPHAAASPVWGHRIVLVNASSEVIARHPVLEGITAHVASMVLVREQVVSIDGPLSGDFTPLGTLALQFLFQGQTVTVPNTTPINPPLVKDARCLPQLNVDQVLTNLAPGPAVVDSQQSSASAYFDFNFGSLRGTTGPDMGSGPAAILMYQTETDGLPVIRIEQFPGPDGDVMKPTNITLRSKTSDEPVIITIMNRPSESNSGQPFDFTLHYLAANGMPTARVSVGPAGCPLNPWVEKFSSATGGGAPADTGPGCSASNLP